MNDSEIAQQIKQMVAFIHQEATEKAKEIKLKADEEFNIEKLRMVEAEKQKIRNEYERKEKQIEVQKRIAQSNVVRLGRLEALKARDTAMQDILADAAVRLWEACVPAIALADEEASSQQPTHGASLPGLPALRRVGGGQKDTGSQLSISLKPKSKADGAKLVGAIEKIGKTDAHFSHVVDPRSGVITVTGSGEMHLQTI